MLMDLHNIYIIFFEANYKFSSFALISSIYYNMNRLLNYNILVFNFLIIFICI